MNVRLNKEVKKRRGKSRFLQDFFLKKEGRKETLVVHEFAKYIISG